jgi:CO/xanthine dehydrogenase Mo-binding subunit
MTVRGPRFVGQSIGRREDQPLLNGTGRFLADTRSRHAACRLLRSSRAHARIEDRCAGALALPG